MLRFLVAFLPVCLAAQPVISNIRSDGISHSSLRLTWDHDQPIPCPGYDCVRIRYGETTNSEAEPGGGILRNGTGTVSELDMTGNVTGLKAGTLYHFCPQARLTSGGTWSTCVDFTETTLAAPAVHPAYPVAPSTFSTAYPDTSGYAAVTVASNCSDLQTKLNTAAAALPAGGTVVTIPVGTICTGQYVLPTNGAAKAFAYTLVDVANDWIDLTSHGFVDDQKIRFSRYSGCLPNSSVYPPGLNCNFAGIKWATDYYAKKINDNRFQILDAPAGAVIDLTTQGTGTNYVMAWPPPSNWIVVRTSTADASFIPEGARAAPAWSSKMATIRPSTHGMNWNYVSVLPNPFATNFRFTGIEFTHPDDSAAADTSVDPPGYYGLFGTEPSSANIVLDRCYIHGLGFPNRLYRAIYQFDGENMAIIDSHLEHLDWWHPYRSPSTAARLTKASGTLVTIGAGTYYGGNVNSLIAAGGVSITITGGTATGTGYIYFSMLYTLHVLLPTGMTATCTGYSPCTVSTMGSPAYPVDANSRVAGAPLGTIEFTAGAVASVTDTEAPSTGVSEGAQSFIAGNGPGPFIIQNNSISGTGIPMHFDDSGSSIFVGHDYTIRRNTFTAPLSQAFGSSWSDNKWYGHRNHLEWKSGQRILVDGNHFSNNFADISAGFALVFTPRSGGYVTDVKVSNNTFYRNASPLLLYGAIDSYPPVSKPGLRYQVVNNLFAENDGYKYRNFQAVPGGVPGIQITTGYGMEDLRIEHNTFYDNRGYASDFLHVVQVPVEGVHIADNLIWLNGWGLSPESQSANTPSCTGNEKTFMDCNFTSGPGTTSYTFSSNTLLPGWVNNEIPSGAQDPTTVAAAFAGLPGLSVVTGADVPARAAVVQWSDAANLNFRLNTASPYRSGLTYPAGDGLDRGADFDALNVAQGLVTQPRALNITTTAADIYFRAPDVSTYCYVLYGTGTDITAYARTPDAAPATRNRSIGLSGLTTGTTYNYVVACARASTQPTGHFTTQ